MEIIKKSEKPFKYEATCPECNSVIGFNRSEIIRPVFNPDHVVCPVCKYKIRRMFWNIVN